MLDARVVNPRWMAAMRRHGYKGAFEMAATVDHLFEVEDATAGVMADWMYEQLTQRYVSWTRRTAHHDRVQPSAAWPNGCWRPVAAQPAGTGNPGRVLLETEGDLKALSMASRRRTACAGPAQCDSAPARAVG